jgi:predicted Zn-ribbon and HTH transcriptional regulator
MKYIARTRVPKCGGTMQKTHAEFVVDLKSKREDVIIIGNYEKALRKARFKFLKCGHEWEITPSHILRGRGCPVCARSRRGASQRLTMEIFLERLHKIDPNLVVKTGTTYKNNRTLMPLRCKICGYEWEISLHDVSSHNGCPNCHKACTSFFEQFIYHTFAHILGKSKVISRDKTAIGAELDIYIPELKAAIEPGSWYWHKDVVAKDKEKHQLCKDKGIRLVTIYDHYNEIAPPFDNCLVAHCDLTAVRNTDKLIGITRTALSEFGLDSNLDRSEWVEIKQKALIDSRRITTEEFKKELAIVNDKVQIIGDYTAANDKIKARCKICDYEWYVAPTSLRLGSGCIRCAGTLQITHDQFVERLNRLQPDLIPLTKYINCKARITMRCNACGYKWSTQPYHLTAKYGRTGCPKCVGKARKAHDDFVAEIAGLSPAILVIGKYVCRKKTVLTQCRECGKIWQSYPNNLLKGHGCKSCSLKKAARKRNEKVKRITTGEVFNTLN